MECLLHYPWPGNVRELEKAIERAVVFASSELVTLEDLPHSPGPERRHPFPRRSGG
jgi:DNA-binding NtrC family response regulator